MCEFHDSSGNSFGDIWWTDKLIYFSSILPFVLKNGNINDFFTNYRPISLLSQFSKILEKVFHNRMMSFIEEKNILHESQYGFRKKYVNVTCNIITC